mmetsp:Transcript_41351/g.89562  ORF Transcript_41351/g.89562 Transcript_41351/m.89562 type:complete len:209 (-) Transcript_41351:342-968(-)
MAPHTLRSCSTSFCSSGDSATGCACALPPLRRSRTCSPWRTGPPTRPFTPQTVTRRAGPCGCATWHTTPSSGVSTTSPSSSSLRRLACTRSTRSAPTPAPSMAPSRSAARGCVPRRWLQRRWRCRRPPRLRLRTTAPVRTPNTSPSSRSNSPRRAPWRRRRRPSATGSSTWSWRCGTRSPAASSASRGRKTPRRRRTATRTRRSSTRP